jgi:hypothetical protein
MMFLHFQRGTGSLQLTPEERALIDLKHTLLDLVRRARLRTPGSLRVIPGRVRFGESDTARFEAENASVSLDLLGKAASAADAQRIAVARLLSESATFTIPQRG